LLRELRLAPPFGDSPLMLLLNEPEMLQRCIPPLLDIFHHVMLGGIGPLHVIVPSDIGLFHCLRPGDVGLPLRLALCRVASGLVQPRGVLAAAFFLLLLIAPQLFLAPLLISACLILALHFPAPVIITLLLAPLFVSPPLCIIVVAHNLLLSLA